LPGFFFIMARQISIQGYAGSFHEQAARQYFGKQVEVLPCDTFRDVIKTAADPKQTSGGVMAIENSIAGSIMANYNLLSASRLTIVGEVYLHIRQQLMVYPGVDLDDIREVHSHPMAILQCMDFLEKHPWKLVESEDTALSAKWIHQYRHKHRAAIASSLAAELYELDIVAKDIHTMKKNFTRFLILAPITQQELPAAQPNKASICFHTDHSQGSLAAVLNVIAQAGVNLSKLQSMPIAGTRFQYAFYADMEFTDLLQFEQVMKEMEPLTAAIRVFGLYQAGII
jgi:prephenate dehydratase